MAVFRRGVQFGRTLSQRLTLTNGNVLFVVYENARNVTKADAEARVSLMCQNSFYWHLITEQYWDVCLRIEVLGRGGFSTNPNFSLYQTTIEAAHYIVADLTTKISAFSTKVRLWGSSLVRSQCHWTLEQIVNRNKIK